MDGTGTHDPAGAAVRRRRLVPLVVLIAAVASTTVALAVTGDPADGVSPAVCAENDPNPEPGLQGAGSPGPGGWDCGVTSVGHLPGGNGAMAVAFPCAYTGGGGGQHGGVRVIDASDPANPVLVGVLDTGSRELLATIRTYKGRRPPAGVEGDGGPAHGPAGRGRLHRRDTRVEDRALLATRHRAEAREGQVIGRDMDVDIWDISEDNPAASNPDLPGCAQPHLLGTVTLPTTSDTFGDPPREVGGPAHNLKFNPSGTKLYGSLPMHEIDLTNLEDPSTWTARNLHCSITDQTFLPHQTVPGLCDQLTDLDTPMGAAGGYPPIDHEPSFNTSGSRLYVGGQLPTPNSNDMLVLDMSSGDPVVVSVTEQAPGHSIDYFKLRDGEGNVTGEYLLHANEINAAGCLLPEQLRPSWLGWADRAFILDITDETAPVKTSEIRLAASEFAHCGPGGFNGPSVAYHEIDDPENATYAVIGFTGSGFRIFDVREPADPVEVAYWNHGDAQHTKSHVMGETGHIWASDAQGFWVLDLEDHVKSQLDLD